MTAAITAETGLDERVLRAIVERFYEKVRRDAVLGPIFEARISDWAPHLDRMVAFWSSVALMTGRYHGRPVPAHARLPVDAAHFERWLSLFRATARETCTPAGAAHVTLRAERIARSLSIAVVETKAGPHAVPNLCLSGECSMTEAAPIYDATELPRYIETRYHARHRQQLPSLVKLAEMVEDLHCDDDGVPNGLADLLAGMVGEVEAHLKKEELILFPAIRKGASRSLEGPINVMRADHDCHERDLDQIRRLTHDMTVPEGACTSWATLYDGLSEFADDLIEHIRLERDVLFPRFEPAA